MATDKKKIEDWEEFVKMVRRSTIVDHSESI